MPVDIDQLTPSRGLIDLKAHSGGDFGLKEYELNFLFDDILLVEFIDIASDGDSILRNGLYVPINATMKAWRKGKVILAGPATKYCNKGDIVIFPNDKGATVSNISVEGYGIVKNGMFLNEQRLFGKCNVIEDESKSE